LVTGTEAARILIVDDERIVRKALRQKLTMEGYYCEEAANASEAVEKLATSPADLAILDIKMPGKAGNELLPAIRRSYPDTAVIMVTALPDTGLVINCMKNGALDYILKPFNLDELALSVQRALRIRELEFKVKEYQHNLEQKVAEQTREIRRVSLGALESLVAALEAKDRYTAGHSRRVSRVALAIGQMLNLSEDEMEDLRWGALLHDIGKIAVDPDVQNKPGKLTPEEYRQVMIHASEGAHIVEPLVNERVFGMIAHHHDHYDGSGLDQTADGEAIPLGARIIAVADTFDAMTSDRPYRSAMTASDSVVEIASCSGTQLDPVVVKALLKILWLRDPA